MRGIRLRGYEIPFRGELESEKITTKFAETSGDLNEAFRRSQHINDVRRSDAEAQDYQNQQFTTMLNLVNDTLVAASGHYADASGTLLYWTAYDQVPVVSNSSRQDLLTGDVTLPWSRSITKLSLVQDEYGDYVASNAVGITYSEEAEAAESKDHEDSIYKAVDNNPATRWLKTYTGTMAYVTIVVALPASTNPAVNSIYVAPFPDHGPTITNVRYLSRAGAWTQVPNFAETDRKRRYHFTPANYSDQVEVTMTPTVLQDSDGNQVRVFGLQNMDVTLIDYVSSSDIVVRLDAAAGLPINSITYVSSTYSISPTVNEDNIDTADKPVLIELYEDAALATLVYSSTVHGHPYNGAIALSSPRQTLWAKFTLRKINSTTPVVRNITVRYS